MTYHAVDNEVNTSKARENVKSGLTDPSEGDCPSPTNECTFHPLSMRLTLCQKVAYGCGGPPMQMLTNCIGFFIVQFLLNIAQLNAYYNSVILFGARAWDAVTDPIVGYLVTKTNTRFGRFRPWLLASAPFGAIFFVLLFYVPDIESMSGRFVYYFIVILVLQTAVTAFHVPYSSMTMVLTTNMADRDSCSMFRMFFELSGVLIGTGTFGSIIHIYNTNSSNITSLNGSLTNSSQIDLESKRYGYLLASCVIALLFILCALVVFFGTREHDVDIQRRENYVLSLRRIVTFRPYLQLMFAFLFISLGIQTIQGNLALYVTISLKLDYVHVTFSIMTLLAVAILFMPVVYFMSVRWGKKTTFRLGLVNILPISLVILLMPTKPPIWAFYLCMVWAAPSISVAFLMPWSMLPNVIDAFMLKNGVRREAAFYSLYVFFNKFAVGIAVGVSSIVLGLSGYDVQKEVKDQLPSVGNALQLLIGLVGLGSFSISFLFLHFYPIDEDRISEIKSQLVGLRANGSSASMDMSVTQSSRSLIVREPDACDVSKYVEQYNLSLCPATSGGDNNVETLPGRREDLNHNSYCNPVVSGDGIEVVTFKIGQDKIQPS